MARIYPLFSSSSGNSSFIGNKNGGILIDAGVSCKRLCLALMQNEIPIEAVKAIFVTHDHCDHISGLKVLTKNFKIPVFASPKTTEWLCDRGHISSEINEMQVGASVDVAGFEISSFKTPHDAVESVGYKILTPDGKKMCHCTDLGHIAPIVAENLKGSDLVLLEANYDERMLRVGPYPISLKQRIVSPEGHLSNTASARQVKELVEKGTTRIILGHLSQENNTPQIVQNTICRELGSEMVSNRDFLMYIAPVENQGLAVAF